MPTHLLRRLERRTRARCVGRVLANLTTATMVAVVVFASGACSDATGPSSPITVTVSVDQFRGPAMRYPQDSEPIIGCGTDLRAVAKGTGDASWLGASIQFFGGKGKSRLVSTGNLTPSAVQSAWGKPTIAAGESQRSVLSVSASEPFKAVVQYSYQPPSGGQQTAEVSIDCGPTAPADAAAPSVTALSAHSSGGNLEPGDTLIVEYTETSSAGLWDTEVKMAGPCEVARTVPDSLLASVTRTVRLVVPFGCALGVPITVTVTPKDAVVQTGSRTLATGISLVDETPPLLFPIFFPRDGGSGTTTLSGDYFAGDLIHLMPNAYDNAALHALVWEFLPAGVKDSLVVSGLSMPSTIGIPIPLDVTGPVQFRLYAHDAVGLTSDTVTTPQDGTIMVHPTLQQPVKSATVSGEIRDVAIDARRGLVYLMQTNERRLAVLTLDGMTVTQVPMPSFPSQLDLTPSGDSLLVLFPGLGALGVIDVGQSSLQPSIVPLMGFDTAGLHTSMPVAPDMNVAANGKVFVSLPSTAPDSCTLLEVDLATGTQRVRTDAGDGGVIGDGAMVGSLDHSVIVLTGGPTYFQRYDASTDTFGPRESATLGAPDAWDIASMDAKGDWLALGPHIYDGSLQFRATIGAPAGGVPVTALSAAGDVMYEINWFQGIIRVNVGDGTLRDRILNSIRPSMLRASADGTLLITVDSQYSSTSRISVIELP